MTNLFYHQGIQLENYLQVVRKVLLKHLVLQRKKKKSHQKMKEMRMIQYIKWFFDPPYIHVCKITYCTCSIKVKDVSFVQYNDFGVDYKNHDNESHKTLPMKIDVALQIHIHRPPIFFISYYFLFINVRN